MVRLRGHGVDELPTVAQAQTCQADGELPYAYALTGPQPTPREPIRLPYPVLGTVKSVAPQNLCRPQAWPRGDHGWPDREPMCGWQDLLSDLTDGLDDAAWRSVVTRCRYALEGALRRVRAELIADGTLPPRAVCLLDQFAQ